MVKSVQSFIIKRQVVAKDAARNTVLKVKHGILAVVGVRRNECVFIRRREQESRYALCVPCKSNVTIRNQPSCSNSSRFRTLQAKKAMFNLNENNRIVMSQHPSDMRIGVNGMCGQVRKVGLDPSNGDVYIFVGRSRQLMKILHWERGGYVMYYKRLEQGRFHPRIFLREGIGFRTMRWDELVLLMEGISPKVARRKRFPTPNGKLELSRKK